ncbi:hypothetical protein GOP47_0030163 [Adiantum capillus-veneris]|nr:hypothetical protein GOP47_0030163 [Adiantum capillus-veneris]
MFPQLASTAASFTRASSLVLKAGTDAHFYDDPHDADIVRLLDSKFDAEKVEALKRLLALISQGSDVSTFFPQVVKSVASSNLEVKKLVYIYLVHYAEKRPDEALLSINTFQKDLVDFNPLVRAWALRAMCGIRVHVVAPLMIMAVQKCAKDPSPYVRRSAANAIPKLYVLNPEQYVDVLEELIGLLLDDKSAGVLGAAAAAFNAVCPENFGIIAPRFQELCRLLTDVEEWGQVLLVDILLRYVVAAHGYPGKNEAEEVDGRHEVPHDRRCLLQSTVPLMWSHNSSVVLAATGVHWILAPSTQLMKTVKPLLFLLRSSYDTQYVVLANLLTLVKNNPSLFEEYYDDFFVRSSDSLHVRAMKLEILALIATKSSIAAILQELQAYIRDPDRDFAANAVSAIGKCAVRHPTIASTCTEGLLSLIQGGCKMSSTDQGGDRDMGVIVQAVLAIRSVASHHFKQVEKVFVRLICDLDLIRVAAARAVVIWMVGEYGSRSSIIREILPTVFSYLASCFVNEENESKLQILSCISKILVQSWEDLGASFKIAVMALTYVLDLGVSDGNYDVRDRARMLKQLLGLHKALDDSQVSDVLSKLSLEKLPVPNVRTLSKDFQDDLRLLPNYILTFSKLRSLPVSSSHVRTFILGSMSHIVNHSAPGYRPLPEPNSFTALPVRGDTHIPGHLCSDPTNSQKESSQQFDRMSDYTGSLSSDLSNSEADDDDDDTASRVLSANNGYAYSQTSENESCSSNGAMRIHGGAQGNSSSLDREAAVEPLIHLSDDEAADSLGYSGTRMQHVHPRQSAQTSLGTRTAEDLESWLTADSFLSKHSCTENRLPSGFLNLSMDSIKREPRKMTLLDFTNGEGLEVKYSFCFRNSVYYDKMVWVKLHLTNRSSDALSAISLKQAEAETSKDVVEPGVLVFPSPEVQSLEPHQVKEFDVHVDFRQQLVPVKLAVHCNRKCFVVKLVPDVGAFLRPKVMSFEEFGAAEGKLVGMFEMTYRCSAERPMRSQNFAVLDADEEALALTRVLATRVLSQINVFLVMATIPVYTGAINDDVLNVHLKFSGETLVDSSLCLITITLELQSMGDSTDALPVLVKVNCEDSVFGLNLLNRLQKVITEKQ